MTMFFAKKLNKKGFTLAEMLIVVAIIAILVAIAVPIFTNSLDKANKAVYNANKRAVKASAVVTILDRIADGKETNVTGPWSATGTFDADGNLTAVKIDKTLATSDTTYATWKGDKTTITVVIKEVDVTIES